MHVDSSNISYYAQPSRLFPQLNGYWFYFLSLFLILILISNKVSAAKFVFAAAEKSNPTSYLSNQKKRGILVDVITEVFSRSGHTIEILLMPWARCLREVKNGSVDGIFSVYKTPERMTFLSYTDEVLITQVQAFFVTSDSSISFDGDLRKLANKSISIINQTSYGPRLDSALEAGVFNWVSQAQSSQSNVKKLLAGRVDLIPSYRHVALSTAKSLGASAKIRQLSPDIEAIPSYLAFTNKRDFSKAIAEFNHVLASMKEDGSYDKIFNKYLF
ncbi:substrate-binding periplasmic protein [Paraglaciecola arctica]|uniref:substrate-binding periplasmic protein n=1 Tax=Paraglaciecola arctica TaxID=1128911 RepID=UPI001C078F2A|nr:transporter substrate-binding domain-containing protein [Paraglaciecola arctica]MBU3005765.1 transporter substrate-binding domain-containing protein [Paraglaciecola arctica]